MPKPHPEYPQEERQTTTIHMTSRKQLKQSHQLSFPQQDDCKSIMHDKTMAKHNPTNSGRKYKQQTNNNRSTDFKRTAANFTWVWGRKIKALDSAVIKTQNVVCVQLVWRHPTYLMYYHWESINTKHCITF